MQLGQCDYPLIVGCDTIAVVDRCGYPLIVGCDAVTGVSQCYYSLIMSCDWSRLMLQSLDSVL